MGYIGKEKRRIRRPVPEPVRRQEPAIPAPDWPKPEPAEAPIEAPGWPQPVKVSTTR